MKNDGQCWIHIPTDLTDPTITNAATLAINQLHQLLNKPLVSTGQRNPYYDVITQIGIAEGAAIERSTPLAACGPISNLNRVRLDLVDLVVAVGGDVEGLPVFFELTTDPTLTDCPFSTLSPKEKWSVWGTFGESHVPTQLGSNWYRSSAVGQSGKLMNASYWSAISRSNVISLADFQAIQIANGQVP